MNPTLTFDEVKAHLDEWGLADADLLLADATYAFFTVEFVTGDFAVAAENYLAKIVGNYEAEDADCDDFAEACACFAHAVHRKTLTRPRETAVAFGEFWFTTHEGEGHAINCFISLISDVWKLLFFEPQTCELVTLTPEEITSCEMLRF